MFFTASCVHLTRLKMADVIHALVINDVIVSCLLSLFISTPGVSFYLISNLVCTSQFIIFKFMVNEDSLGWESQLVVKLIAPQQCISTAGLDQHPTCVSSIILPA